MSANAERDAAWDKHDRDKTQLAHDLRDAIAVEQAQKRPDAKRLRKLRAQLEQAEDWGS